MGLGCVYPNHALKIWYNLFNEILNKHSPIVTKRVKRDKQPEWYNTEVCVYNSILFWGLWILLTCYCRNFV
jgi:hypothetical protein